MRRRAFLGLFAAGCGDDMFSRRSPRMNRRGLGAATGTVWSPTEEPQVILGDTCIQFCQAEYVVTAGSVVAQLTDLARAPHHYSAIGTARPTYNTTDTSLNDLPTLSFNGTAHRLDGEAWSIPAPATRPTWLYAILRQPTNTSNENIFADATATFLTLLQGGTNNLAQNNGDAGSNTNAGLALDTWGRVEGYYSDTVDDYLRAAANTIGGDDAGGNGPGSARRIGGNAAGSTFTRMDLYAVIYCSARPTILQLSQLDDHYADRCGAGILG